MNIQLTEAQRQQQQLINGFITDLERQVQNPGAAPVNMDLGEMLNGLFGKFDGNGDKRFNSNELTSLAGHLRRLNTEQNIAQLFTADGQVKLDIANANLVDITGDGTLKDQEDLVALQHILASRSSTSTSQTVSSSNSGEVSAGIGNATNGIKHFNSRGSFFVTEGGFTILTDTNVGGHTTQIYDDQGKLISKIWGDPHVGDGAGAAGGNSWHFGNDSTFILPDGTEIMFNTEGNANNNIYVTTGLYIKSGNDVYQTGQDFGTKTTGVASDARTRNASITKLGMSATEFDARYADAAADANGAGVFAWTRSANNGVGGWAILTERGVFQDVRNESWGDYLKTGGASFRGQYEGVVQASKAQMIAALDGDAVRSFDIIKQNIKDVPGSNRKSDDLFLEYYFQHGANSEELRTFANMLANGSSASKMQYLDDYIKNGADVQLNESQERKFLSYLVSPSTTRIAETYLELIEDGADAKKFELLDNLATGRYNMTSSQQETFFNYLLNFDNSKLAEIYASIIEKGGNQDSLNLLESYASGQLGVNMNTDQENKMLNYLDSSNSNIARTYINFVRDGADESSFATLDDIFTRAGSTREVLTEDDLRFDQGFATLLSTFNVGITSARERILDNFNNVPIDSLNSILDMSIDALENATSLSITRVQIDSLFGEFSLMLENPKTAIFDINGRNAQKRFEDGMFGKNPEITREILNVQSTLLDDMDQSDAQVIANRNTIRTLRSWLPDSDGRTGTGGGNNDGNTPPSDPIYAAFLSSFNGTAPTAAQRRAAETLMSGPYAFGDNVSLMGSYGRLVASGDEAAAAKLFEIAQFFGNGPLSNNLPRVNNSDISASDVDAAYSAMNLIKDMQAQSPTAFSRAINQVNDFLIGGILGEGNGYNTGEGGITKAFLEAWRTQIEDNETLTDAQMSGFINGSVFNFRQDLHFNGAVNSASIPQQIANNPNVARSYNQDTAEIQINIFQSMINFFNNQITLENTKETPDTGKISQFTAQINSHRSAITALERISS